MELIDKKNDENMLRERLYDGDDEANQGDNATVNNPMPIRSELDIEIARLRGLGWHQV